MVSLIIPVFNKAELTERCLNSVLQNSKVLKEVFVIDNGSTDRTPALLLQFKSQFENSAIRFEVIQNEINRGFGSACNQGVRLAGERYVAILNNDTWVMNGWDDTLQEECEVRGLDEVGPFFDERPLSADFERVAAAYLKSNRNHFRKHFVPILMFFKAESLERLKLDHGGIFDERFFVTYEDTDLLHRMKQLKLRFGQTSNCYIWHQSMGTRSSNLLPKGYEQEGLSLFIKKWNFDPRLQDHTFIERWKRKIRKNRAARGLF
jgi:GT2 family glycosyltransferase